MASFDFFWCCDIDLKHSENKCRHLVDCFINMNNCAIMMRDFRYLRVTSPDGRGLYEIYENHEGNERENEIPKRKTTRLPVLLFFFNGLKPTARHYCENHSHLQTTFCI